MSPDKSLATSPAPTEGDGLPVAFFTSPELWRKGIERQPERRGGILDLGGGGVDYSTDWVEFIVIVYAAVFDVLRLQDFSIL